MYSGIGYKPKPDAEWEELMDRIDNCLDLDQRGKKVYKGVLMMKKQINC